ncbi:MAG: O-antigen ligase family protein, partial [Bacteroidales bacterium]
GLWEICTARYFFVQETYAIRYTECALGSFVHRPLPVATFSNVNDLSSFLYFSFFIALALFFLRTNKAAKVLDVFCMLIYLVVIVAGQSRSVFLGFILALLALLIYWICKFIRQKKWKRIGIWTLVGVTVLGCCLFLTKETLLSSNFWLDDRSDTSRMNLMKDGFIYLYNHWFMGVGWGNIEYYRSQSMDPMSIDTITQIHNWWMEILVTSGIFIFAGYLWIYLRNYKHLFQASLVLKNRVEQKNMLVFFMAFTGCVIVFVASSSFVRCDWFWVILALLFAYCGHHPISNENQKKLDL